VRFIDPDGCKPGPGDQFASLDEAAMDFGKTYNDNSIKDNKEYNTRIYKTTDRKTGKVSYSYNPPSVGSRTRSIPLTNASEEGELAGTAYTHGKFDTENPDEDTSDFLSPEDSDNANDRGVPVFVATPNGSLRKYDPVSKFRGKISSEMPSDEDHPKRLNEIDSKPLPKDEPTTGIGTYILLNIIFPLLEGASKVKG
jgi:hypothetical protein